MNKLKKIVTHSGRFHADETFGAAVLKLVFPESAVVRTRDPEVIESADIVLDVGGVYDAERDRFDHHQAGGAGVRKNGIPYASFGLVWKKYGAVVAGSLEAATIIEKEIVMPIDATDNGVDISTSIFPDVFPFAIQDILFLFAPTWQEQDRTFDQGFFETLPFVEKIIKRAIVEMQAQVLGDLQVKQAYNEAKDKKIIVLDGRYMYQEVLCSYPEPLFVVLPDSGPGTWKLETLPEKRGVFGCRKKLPATWAGKRDKELQDVTGVPDAVFCHNGRFVAVSKSKEGVLKLGNLALKD
jgi:uncharacterized UPF0160 family protein